MLGYKTTRTTSALKSRFKTVQLDVNKYSACVLRVQTAPTSGFNAVDNAIVNDIAKWYHYVEGVKGRQHKGDTNNYLFDLNSENSGADECMRSPHGRPSPSSINLSDDGSLFSQSEGLERPPGRKASKARKQKAKPYNVNLLPDDILGYEARSNDFYKRDVTLKAVAEERKRNFVREMEEKKLEFAAKDLTEREKQRIIDEKNFESKMMFCNPNSLPSSEARIWLIQQQWDIIRKNGGGGCTRSRS
ncbi:hypothetical protein Dsin_001544 [Dipteronia sinensis]|uniref:No apical meristem-associated C-terminal domain-containing protein n=1 Tax=Dipteronia sinensis TaxID=43782 RepID=A0AAE0B472_9ROSI|nr:hypothetical protein Dsin_001544 [Dipteronia sinensis]